MKERLTGALILVALLVILVPEILPGPVADRPAGEEVPAPAADGPPLRTYSLELGAGGDRAGAGQSALAPQAAPPVAAAASREAEPAPREPALAPPVRDQGKPESTPRASAEVAPAEVAAKPAAAAANGAAQAGNWWVQLGSFSQAENAQRLAQSLVKSGFRAQVSPMRSQGKDLYRVRSGPVADRAAAEALRARLAEAGHKGTLVAP